MRVWLPLVMLLLGGCVAAVAVREVADLAGPWRGRIAGPRGNAAAEMTVDGQGAYKGTMFLDAGDRLFHGRLVVVRPGEVRYQGSDGSGAARLYHRGARSVLKFRGDDDGTDAEFSR